MSMKKPFPPIKKTDVAPAKSTKTDPPMHAAKGNDDTMSQPQSSKMPAIKIPAKSVPKSKTQSTPLGKETS